MAGGDHLRDGVAAQRLGRLAGIEDWINGTIEKGKHPRLVIVDTLAQFRKLANGKQIYLEDYTAISELQKLASKYNIAIIVVHHDRKGGADDVFDTVSGSLGLTGAADTIAMLKRQSGSVTLHIRGRDVEEAEKAIQFNKDTCRWTMLGEASEIRRSDQRAKVLAVIGGATDGMSPTDLADELGITSANAKQLLRRMANDGEWPAPGFTDTEIRCHDGTGGVSWIAGDIRVSSRLKR